MQSGKSKAKQGKYSLSLFYHLFLDPMKKVLITRPRAQAADFGAALQAAGLEPVYFPVIEIRPVDDLSPFTLALSRGVDWVVFTSVNAVDAVFSAPLSTWDGLRLAAVGRKTADALRQHGLEPDFIPQTFTGPSVLPGLGELTGKTVLLPRSEIARPELPAVIRAAGGIALEVTVYHTLPAEVEADGLKALQTHLDWVTFTSPSTVENFVALARRYGVDGLAIPAACIGPTTAEAAREAGFARVVTAEEYTVEGLVQVLL